MVVEGDDLRPLLRLEVALEISRQIDGANGLAGSDRPRGRGKIAGGFGDAETRRGRHLFNESARSVGAIRVHNHNTEPADHRMTEYRGQRHEGGFRGL